MVRLSLSHREKDCKEHKRVQDNLVLYMLLLLNSDLKSGYTGAISIPSIMNITGKAFLLVICYLTH